MARKPRRKRKRQVKGAKAQRLIAALAEESRQERVWDNLPDWKRTYWYRQNGGRLTPPGR